uniref:Uncharacterized protein n=1 Tax=Rhizophora mucronata TaxID=61149 RepID=A0A2P2P023_RHIMU
MHTLLRKWSMKAESSSFLLVSMLCSMRYVAELLAGCPFLQLAKYSLRSAKRKATDTGC